MVLPGCLIAVGAVLIFYGAIYFTMAPSQPQFQGLAALLGNALVVLGIVLGVVRYARRIRR